MEAKDRCDITISIDCDGQDDINAMDQMIELYQKGNEVVYGVRDNRDSDTFFKRFTAENFYKMMKWMGVESVFNHADYRLLSSKVLQSFSEFQEVNLFLRGMIPLVGYPSAAAYYARRERIAGESHYPLRKMLALAIDGITSLSVKPIRLITGVGIFAAIIGFLGILWSIFNVVFAQTVAGWASMTCMICFMGGVQLLSLGIIGEYIGKIYMETKHRPRYIISERTENMDTSVGGQDIWALGITGDKAELERYTCHLTVICDGFHNIPSRYDGYSSQSCSCFKGALAAWSVGQIGFYKSVAWWCKPVKTT